MQEKSSFENARKNIQRGGKLLYRASRIIAFALTVLVIVHAIALLSVFTSDKAAYYIRSLYENNAFYRLIDLFADLRGLPSWSDAAIGCFAALLSYLVLLLFVRMVTRMMRYLAQGGRPFDISAAKTVRAYSWLLLVLALYNPALGLISFALSMLFSYIMEYGGYIQARADETNRIQEEIIVSFAEITENKSGQTGQHIRRVSEYARVLAEELGLDEESCEKIRIASTMHDIGKLMIPSEILEKPGRLTDEEYSVIKTHTTYGGQLLENVEGEEMQLSRTIALQHHERWDGRGYPRNLANDAISLEGRIVAVADVYDALTSRRSYKQAWDEERAFREIKNGRGTQFDPVVVDAFERAHDKILEVQKKFAD